MKEEVDTQTCERLFVMTANDKLSAEKTMQNLGVYLEHPEQNPEGRIVDFDDDFVVIKDKFPKARSAKGGSHACLNH